MSTETVVRRVKAVVRGYKCDNCGHFEPANKEKQEKAYKILNANGKEYTLCYKCGGVLEESLDVDLTEQGEWNYVPDSSRRSDSE